MHTVSGMTRRVALSLGALGVALSLAGAAAAHRSATVLVKIPAPGISKSAVGVVNVTMSGAIPVKGLTVTAANDATMPNVSVVAFAKPVTSVKSSTVFKVYVFMNRGLTYRRMSSAAADDFVELAFGSNVAGKSARVARYVGIRPCSDLKDYKGDNFTYSGFMYNVRKHAYQDSPAEEILDQVMFNQCPGSEAVDDGNN